ncbi:hypothetical protein TBLA_0F03400 [Henningerozyma blattae CBS 6284]|uniref:MICOS complex subunit MIC12 n=1 Tax=Henningerozyma blattae (strain ATCC 34711 / CBS 6284 / DSM 70876 / NBRC 10599 / NRRL Y-10934 / UCD 77-7) TaxID=1071380 RepID=I2H675_HENB6|nr:hypothetical protein TBLA_0F03400 [Tetrapisispora blattae CBS 6284]CCH61877.1 hypothetical protein TBLA_0F03400 [Tetrapisispora blattae CBS 6284]
MRVVTKLALIGLGTAAAVSYTNAGHVLQFRPYQGSKWQELNNDVESILNRDVKNDPIQRQLAKEKLIGGDLITTRQSAELLKDLWNKEIRGLMSWIYSFSSTRN